MIKPRQPSTGGFPDYSKAFYADPPSHDFCVFLMIADTVRKHYGVPGPLKVKFGLIEGQLGKFDFGDRSPWGPLAYECNVSREYYETMLENVLRPAMKMIGAVEYAPVYTPWQLNDLQGYVEYDYHIGHLVDAGREGHKIPQWKVPQWAFDEVDKFLIGSKPIVITLRETTAQPERNSQIGEWWKFAMWAEANGHLVLFVRDTGVSESDRLTLPFARWHRASQNVYVRAALYQRALVNMMVCNGPNTWCIFSDAPYLIFKELVPALPDWAHGRPDGWRDQDHMEVGDQYPWASPLQRLTWTDDTFENIKTAFDEFLEVSSLMAQAVA